MTWDWAIDTFKGLIVAGVTWTVIYLRKQAKPLIKSLRKFSKLVELTDELKSKIAVLESKQVAAWDILKDPLYTVNIKGEVDYANTSWAKMGGLSDPRDGFGFGYMQMIPDEDKDRVEKLAERITEHPSPFEGIIRFYNKQTGKIIITECRTALVYDLEKKVIGTIGRLYIISEEPPK